jgi:hypothetical protein
MMMITRRGLMGLLSVVAGGIFLPFAGGRFPKVPPAPPLDPPGRITASEIKARMTMGTTRLNPSGVVKVSVVDHDPCDCVMCVYTNAYAKAFNQEFDRQMVEEFYA